ncbi:MAG: hypothetical protein J5781_08035, partial [Clostridia bacterium]|nr:hypothetical protein [Clostridia bacterium]
CVVGICVNDGYFDQSNIDVRPHFVDALSFAEADRETPKGKVSVRWERQNDGILLTVDATDTLHGSIALPEGYAFEDGQKEFLLRSGAYKIKKQ